ncbi:uncharacterized protein LOC110976159 [Acanthaster planci]|uniref:Uncharacterized protein LOC110976159 n=1 Tax=Acanthaster planci TaxID=133434 RepID=A0A8B7XXC8_ACAPL|nr:uncharacterized protein LOC110976159 [Acanthaster planci]
MARFSVFGVIFSLVVAASAESGDDNPFAFEIYDDVTIEPTYDPDSGAVGILVTVEFKRSVSQPLKSAAFSLLDKDGDGLLTVEEWRAERGCVANFIAFLTDLDANGDKRISWAEFQSVRHVYTKY